MYIVSKMVREYKLCNLKKKPKMNGQKRKVFDKSLLKTSLYVLECLL